MKIWLQVTLAIWLQHVLSVVGSKVLCEKQQFIEFGRTGKLQCTFKEGFDGVYWYNTNNSVSEQPLLKLENVTKSGEGYESGAFDISPDGSLVIRNTSFQHEHMYRTVVRYSNPVIVQSADVNVVVISKPYQQNPYIDKCGEEPNCFIIVEQAIRVLCSIQHARPPLSLRWFKRTVVSDNALPCDGSVYPENGWYTSKCNLTVNLNNPFGAGLFVCIADDTLGMLHADESIILIHIRPSSIPRITFNETLVQNNSHVRLSCPIKNKVSAVWEKWTAGNTLASSISQYGFHGTLSHDVRVTEDGTLIFNPVQVEDEAKYICYPIGGFKEDINGFKLSVYVVPGPPYVFVDGCEHQLYCVLPSGPTGYLTCSVIGIRPIVELKWTGHSEMSSQTISFTEQRTTITQRGYIFDISLTTKYDVTASVNSRLTLRCLVAGKNASVFKLHKTLDIVINREPDSKRPIWMISFVVIPVVPILLYLVYKGFLKKENNNNNATTDELETIQLSIPLDEKCEEFKRAIKWRYKSWFEAVKPIPFYEDQMYNVNDVFVETDLQILSTCGTGKQKWQSVNSYRAIFTPEYERVILEGEPGFGKTTICLQAVYEWCKNDPQGPFANIQWLIVLRLNELREDISIFSAIKMLFLPEDSSLSADDIRLIIQQGKSVVLVFDGYDEMSFKQNHLQIDNIFNGRQLQKCRVILCTRLSVLPKQIVPQTKRFRLSGFDPIIRQAYVANMLSSNNPATPHSIREYLEKNPVLSDLCDIPLFFVLFAHLINDPESGNKGESFDCNTATGLMKNIMKCIYSHRRNKCAIAGVECTLNFESKHTKLDKVAYDYLFHKDMNIDWLEDSLHKEIGQDHFRELVQLGILVDNTKGYTGHPSGRSSNIKPVKFYHKIFCEWYAAHHLANIASKSNFKVVSEKKIKFVNVTYVYQFASGINEKAAKVIIKKLLKESDGATLATLCLFEETGNEEDLEEIIQHLCKHLVVFSADENKIFQRAKIKLLETAAKHMVSIKRVLLDQCFLAEEMPSSNLYLNSGLMFPCLKTLKTLFISEEGRCVTKNEAVQLLKFAASCKHLRKLRITGCMLPFSFEIEVSSKIGATVKWTPFPNIKYFMDGQSGFWKSKVGVGHLEESEYKTLERQFYAHYRFVYSRACEIFNKWEVET